MNEDYTGSSQISDEKAYLPHPSSMVSHSVAIPPNMHPLQGLKGMPFMTSASEGCESVDNLEPSQSEKSDPLDKL